MLLVYRYPTEFSARRRCHASHIIDETRSVPSLPPDGFVIGATDPTWRIKYGAGVLEDIWFQNFVGAENIRVGGLKLVLSGVLSNKKATFHKRLHDRTSQNVDRGLL